MTSEQIKNTTGLLTTDEKKEIDSRLERFEKGEAKLFSWEEVKNEIKSGLWTKFI